MGAPGPRQNIAKVGQTIIKYLDNLEDECLEIHEDLVAPRQCGMHNMGDQQIRR